MKNCLFCGRKLSSPISLSFIFSFAELEEKMICESCFEKFDPIDLTKSCPACSRQQEANDLCADCKAWKIKYPNLSFKHKALFSYNEMAKEYIKMFKFQGDLLLGKLFKKEVQHFLSTYERSHQIVPIPISQSSFEERGFNQVEVILQNAGIQYEDCLIHLGKGQRQSSKTRQERLTSKQFLDLEPNFFRNKNRKQKILIVDDIYTTGRTISHAKNLFYQKDQIGESSQKNRKVKLEVESFSIFR